MAYSAVPNGIRTTRRHGAHDSALDVESKDEASKMRIRELEEENDALAERAASASQRFADYENEIRVLRTQLRDHERQHVSTPITPDSEHPTPQPERMGLSRFGSFMRKPVLPTPVSQGPSAREQELEAALVKEQSARIEAEKKVKQVNAEIEELSENLFQQANDMVAAERKQNAALRDQIKELESAGGNPVELARKEIDKLRGKLQTMELRDNDKKRRLDKLEAAQKRIDRVRTLLVPR